MNRFQVMSLLYMLTGHFYLGSSNLTNGGAESGNPLHECYTIEEDCILLWFNTEDGSTHILKEHTDI